MSGRLEARASIYMYIHVGIVYHVTAPSALHFKTTHDTLGIWLTGCLVLVTGSEVGIQAVFR